MSGTHWPVGHVAALGVGRRLLLAGTLLIAARPVLGHAESALPATGAADCNGSSPAWFLVGGASAPSIFQPLGRGRALVCTARWCQVYDHATGRWTATGAVVLPLNSLASLCRRDGSVVAVDGARKIASAIWSPTTGRWTSAAALPATLGDLKVAQLADGRIVAAGQSGARQRAYVSDAALATWSLLVDSPPGLSNPRAVPTDSGIVLFSGQRAWRYTVGNEGWREIALADLPLGSAPWIQTWGDEVLVVHPNTGAAMLVDRDERSRRTDPLPAGVGFGLRQIAADGGAEMWLVSRGNNTWLWRRPDEPKLALVENTIEPPYLIIALDDRHLLGVGSSGAVTELSLDGNPPSACPCDGLARYFDQTPLPTPAGSELGLVSAACREALRRGEAPEVLARVRAWVGEAERVEGAPAWSADAVHADTARAFACALQDPAALPALPRWFENREGDARKVCYQSLVSWPAADAAWSRVLKTAVWKSFGTWHVDRALIDLAVAVPTGEMRERLVGVVRTAAERHATGFDDLRGQVCAADPTASGARRQTCAEVAAQHEADWRRRAAAAAAKPLSPAYPILVATAIVAGATVAAHATRHDDASRAIATTSGAIGGLTLGFTATGVALLSSRGFGGPGGDHGEGSLVVAGALLGGALGGIGAYAATASSASRAPVTAAGLAIPYLFTIVVSFH